MKVKCRPSKPDRSNLRDGDGRFELLWKEAAPFLLNPRGYLVHRMRSMTTYFREYEPHHTWCSYWCGNHGQGILLHDPPQDRLVCATCEAVAVANGELPSDQLAARHVHIGKLRAIRVCCQTEN